MAGTFGNSLQPLTFTHSITPTTFSEPDSKSRSELEPASSTDSLLFPPTQTSAPLRPRKRPNKRGSEEHIPRPMNAFLLFRRNFVRQARTPGIDAYGDKLSKIAGLCWKALPLNEKKIWQDMAATEKERHKAKYPNYRFRPVHQNKDKKKRTEAPEEERRCEQIAHLLLEGKTGNEIASSIRELDRVMPRQTRPVSPIFYHHRPSSVPIPNNHCYSHHDIAIPNVPFISRPATPVNSIARQQQRVMLGHRRALSALSAPVHVSWPIPMQSMASLQRYDSSLPKANTPPFNPNVCGGIFSTVGNDQRIMPSVSLHHHQNTFVPLDTISPLAQQPYYMYTNSASSSSPHPDNDPQLPASYPPSYTDPAPQSDDAVRLPVPEEVPIVHAPQPLSAAPMVTAFGDLGFWKEFNSELFTNDLIMNPELAGDAGVGFNFD